MELEQAIGKALDGKAVLFVGAGFCRGAINLKNKPFKTGPQLAAYLAPLSGLPQDAGLEDAAEAFAEEYGEDALIREIKDEFTAKRIQPFHQEVAAVPWKRIYTTNYDNVVEMGCQLAGKRVTPVTVSTDVYKMPKSDLVCVHLNGNVATLDRTKIWSELKLTESSYVTASIAETQWAMLFRQDVRLAEAVFFIGYSLYDLDIKRILAECDLRRDKSFFYLGPAPDESTRRRATRFGQVMAESAEQFVATAKEVGADFVPTSANELSLLSIKEYTASLPSASITDKAFMDLLLLGDVRETLVAESLRTGTRFYLERTSISHVFRRIDEGDRVFVVCSDLGNGKSMFLEGLRLRALEDGYRVFDVCEHHEGVEAELEAVAKLQEKVLVTIEEYQNWLDEIRIFRTNAGDRAVLILTARNAVHDVVMDDLSALAGAEVAEIPIDILDDDEVDWVIDALNEYGLWGEMAGESRRGKVRFVTETCRRQLHALLLKLLESPDIGQRLNLLAERLEQKGEYHQLLLSIFCMAILNQRPTMDVLVDIWGPDTVGAARFRKDPAVGELVDFNRYEVVVRSPVAAEYVLRSAGDAATIVPVLIRMVERAAKGVDISLRYRDLLTALMRFSSLQLLLPEQGRRNAVIRYYESIRNLRHCREHPLFWLQYAIASLVINEIGRAKTYFETAYSLARRKGWNTYQIDNHFARFLMVQAIKGLAAPEALENFRQARAIINRQIRDERRHYPYRVAIHYQEFIDRFGGQFSAAEIEEVGQAATTVLERMVNLPGHRRRQKYVVECNKALKYVAQRCGELLASLAATNADQT